ncbi:MAG: DUF2905 domain-containing protein [Phycisphaerae bacterium]|nr:DUF2905 domain-containing protein [Phycisphaerae bacterium]
MGPGGLGKWLVITGLTIAVVGAAILLLARVGLFKLPGDVEFGGRNWRVFIPVTTSIVLSLILTLIVWLVTYFRR